MAPANEIAVGGTHYKGSKLEHWDYTVRALGNRYLEGNITKYVLRHRHKNGLQDLEKAQHYLTKLQEEFEAGRVQPPLNVRDFDVHRFSMDQGLNGDEAFILHRLVWWNEPFHLEQVALTLRDLIGIARAKEERAQALKIGAVPASPDSFDSHHVSAAEPTRRYVNQDDQE